MTTVSTLGALVALAVAIVLILRKVPPAYGMIAGALAGGLCGGADLVQRRRARRQPLAAGGRRGDRHLGRAGAVDAGGGESADFLISRQRDITGNVFVVRCPPAVVIIFRLLYRSEAKSCIAG